MKTKLFALLTITAVLLTGVCSTTVSAQTQITGLEPIVPIATAIKGRKAITDYLLGKIDHVIIHYSGRSVVGNGWNDQYLDLNTLQYLGYVHRGQFSELATAIYGRAFTGDVVPTPDGGNYELNVQLTFYTVDNRIALQGSGYLPISSDQYGNLSVGSFQPYVSIPSALDIVSPGWVAGAKWTGKNGKSLDLGTSQDGNGNSIITIPIGNLENGFLLFVDGSQKITGWDLTSGAAISGKRIYAILGTLYSSDVLSLNNPVTIDSLGQQFYQWNGVTMGRYPLLDIVTSKAINKAIWFTVPVWGSSSPGISPSHIYFTPTYFSGVSNGYVVGQEYELPLSSAAGGFILNIPANCGFHLRIEFDGLSDWDEVDSNGYPIGKG